jgi:chromosome segregation protein
VAERTRLASDVDRARERIERAQAIQHAGDERHQRVVAEAEQTRREQAELVAGLEAAERRVEALQNLRQASEPDEDASLTELRVELAKLAERLAALERDRQRAQNTTCSLAVALTARAAELDQLQRQRSEMGRERNHLQHTHAALAAEMDARRRESEPLEQARAALFDEIRAAEHAVDLAVSQVRASERERDNAALNLARIRDEQVFLVERIQRDLDMEDPEQLGTVEALTGAEIEQEIRRLRERLRRMSAIGEEVVEEHAQEAARLEHLSRELADIEQAADSLRRLLGDLRRGMQQRFQATFEQVAAEFECAFTRLFGGGGARLTHLTGEDGENGVAIEARPPGKRLQNLGQLSGGERALTAVALLFAIQRVNPSPFCVLDEVDAALDESNVLRFRDELRDLAQTTQYIVITHNRGTIEGADTLYGITMGEDSVSRVISLRMEQAIKQVEDREQLAHTAD